MWKKVFKISRRKHEIPLYLQNSDCYFKEETTYKKQQTKDITKQDIKDTTIKQKRWNCMVDISTIYVH